MRKKFFFTIFILFAVMGVTNLFNPKIEAEDYVLGTFDDGVNRKVITGDIDSFVFMIEKMEEAIMKSDILSPYNINNIVLYFIRNKVPQYTSRLFNLVCGIEISHFYNKGKNAINGINSGFSVNDYFNKFLNGFF